MGKKIKPRQLSFKPRDPMAHLLQDEMFHQRIVKDKRRVPRDRSKRVDWHGHDDEDDF